jgi:hypothetical protein
MPHPLTWGETNSLSISPIALVSVFGNNKRNKGTEDADTSLGLTFSIVVLITDDASTANH